MARVNLSPNPKAKNNVTGWSGNGSAPTRVTGMIAGASFPVDTGARYVSGTFVQPPTAVVVAATQYTVSFYARSTVTYVGGGRQIFVAYTRSAGGDAFVDTIGFGLTADTTTRISFTVTSPALATGIYLIVDFNTTITQVDFSAMLIEPTGTLNAYADGDTSQWVWDGADGNSSSTEQATPTVIPDGIAIPVTFGSPTARMVVDPTGLAIPITFGTPIVTTDNPPVFGPTPNGWYGLLSIYKEKEPAARPVACPVCGEPLVSNRAGVLGCTYCGWKHYG